MYQEHEARLWVGGHAPLAYTSLDFWRVAKLDEGLTKVL